MHGDGWFLSSWDEAGPAGWNRDLPGRASSRPDTDSGDMAIISTAPGGHNSPLPGEQQLWAALVPRAAPDSPTPSTVARQDGLQTTARREDGRIGIVHVANLDTEVKANVT